LTLLTHPKRIRVFTKFNLLNTPKRHGGLNKIASFEHTQKASMHSQNYNFLPCPWASKLPKISIFLTYGKDIQDFAKNDLSNTLKMYMGLCKIPPF
jgi:hypothetical protein